MHVSVSEPYRSIVNPSAFSSSYSRASVFNIVQTGGHSTYSTLKKASANARISFLSTLSLLQTDTVKEIIIIISKRCLDQGKRSISPEKSRSIRSNDPPRYTFFLAWYRYAVYTGRPQKQVVLLSTVEDLLPMKAARPLASCLPGWLAAVPSKESLFYALAPSSRKEDSIAIGGWEKRELGTKSRWQNSSCLKLRLLLIDKTKRTKQRLSVSEGQSLCKDVEVINSNKIVVRKYYVLTE